MGQRQVHHHTLNTLRTTVLFVYTITQFYSPPSFCFWSFGSGSFCLHVLGLLTKATLMASGQQNPSTLEIFSTVSGGFGEIWCFVSSRETRARCSLGKKTGALGTVLSIEAEPGINFVVISAVRRKSRQPVLPLEIWRSWPANYPNFEISKIAYWLDQPPNTVPANRIPVHTKRTAVFCKHENDRAESVKYSLSSMV
ncbi:hypothetical protein RvY_18436 [Ramazzottius varieornatus]|uniref:Uncharacterized protein n=1 Tax=Ramazzottius varieornatus TaxID=947166 RepID=A0A1D1W7B4_RAMVA|nr:hypothetical protein RvY_18436 [Ramazzottius varieornatus]